jgi:hypothetical protein
MAKQVRTITARGPEGEREFRSRIQGQLSDESAARVRIVENFVRAGAVERHVQLYASLASFPTDRPSSSIWKHFKWADNCGKRDENCTRAEGLLRVMNYAEAFFAAARSARRWDRDGVIALPEFRDQRRVASRRRRLYVSSHRSLSKVESAETFS